MPVEAIACGCPVLALAEGGVLDSMTSDTAVFFHEQTPEALERAMLQFEARSNDFLPATLRARAADFSEAHFVTRFKEIVAGAIAADPNLNCQASSFIGALQNQKILENTTTQAVVHSEHVALLP